MPGQERPIEVAGPPLAANDLRDRHGLHAPVRLALRPYQAAHVGEGQHLVLLALQEPEDAAHDLALPGPAEIAPGDGIESGAALNHRPASRSITAWSYALRTVVLP